jgi:hypothetical protein
MKLTYRLVVSSAFCAALFAATVSAAAAIPHGATFTNVRPVSLKLAGGTLSGQLQQTSSCNKVEFIVSPATIVPPIYGAYQVPVRKTGCVILNNHLVLAKAPAVAKAVTVQAKNGNFPVK